MGARTDDSGAADVAAGVDRRRFLRISAAAGMAGAAVVLDPALFSGAAAASPAASPAEETRVATGRLQVGASDWVYLPVDVPRGVRELSVRYPRAEDGHG